MQYGKKSGLCCIFLSELSVVQSVEIREPAFLLRILLLQYTNCVECRKMCLDQKTGLATLIFDILNMYVGMCNKSTHSF